MLQSNPYSPERLAAANINPRSFLATDYLNHFNEVVMLMEMLPDMPDMAQDVMAWEPCGYAQHFEQSVFAERQLAIDAYRAAPAATRAGLEAVVAQLEARIIDTQILLSGVDPSLPLDRAIAERLALTIADELRPAIDRASGIINASDTPLVDANDNVAASHEATDEPAMERAQDAIDKLFA